MVMWPKTILPSRGGLAVGGEGATVHRLGARLGPRRILGKTHAFQSGRRGVQGGIERLDLGPGIEGDDVEQIELPAVEARAGGAGAVGDALHFLEIFLVVAAQEQGIDQGARRLPAVGRRLGTLHGGEAADDARRSLRPAAGHAASRVDTVRPRCAARSSRPADSDRPGRNAAPNAGPARNRLPSRSRLIRQQRIAAREQTCVALEWSSRRGQASEKVLGEIPTYYGSWTASRQTRSAWCDDLIRLATLRRRVPPTLLRSVANRTGRSIKPPSEVAAIRSAPPGPALPVRRERGWMVRESGRWVA